jgi:hypothetical protein
VDVCACTNTATSVSESCIGAANCMDAIALDCCSGVAYP